MSEHKVTREYRLDGLGCASCAMKMEDGLKGIDGVTDSTISFATKKLKLTFDGEREAEIVAKGHELISSIEPEVVMKPVGKGSLESHGHSHGSAEPTGFEKVKLAVAAAGFLAGALLPFPDGVSNMLLVFAYVVAGAEVVEHSLRNVMRGEVFDENFLMLVASLGAIAIGELPEAVAVMVFYAVGEYFQDRAVERSRRSIAALMDIRPDSALLTEDGEVRQVHPEQVKEGQRITVLPGEKIPLDGVVVGGSSFVDTSTLTGESVPRRVAEGDEVLSGSLNQSGSLLVQVSKEFRFSTVSRILALVEEAAEKKASSERFITRFARVYTPVVVFGALFIGLAVPLITGGDFQEWISRALVFLVASCPCALVLSVPLTYFAGIGGASARGILIKGGNTFDALKGIDTVAMDKTGTLTAGTFRVTKVFPGEGVEREHLLRTAAVAESRSNHPIAKSVLAATGGNRNEDVEEYEERPGRGVVARTEGVTVAAGNEALMAELGVDISAAPKEAGILYIAEDGRYLGALVVEDEITPDSAEGVRRLKEAGLETVLLTGDAEDAAQKVAEHVGIEKVFAKLLPREKAETVERLTESGRKVLFVGDGINDAPVLMTAQVGVAMGGIGSDAAIEASDAVLMDDSPAKVATLLRIGTKVRSLVTQNIVFALAFKAAVLALGALGYVNMWLAVFADVGVAILAVLNGMRALRVK